MINMNSSAHRIKYLFYFLTGNYILSLLIAHEYLSFAPTWDDPLGWFYTRIAYLSHFAILVFIPGIILLPFTLFIRSRIQMRILPPLIMYLYQIILLVDVKIYSLFRFHFNGLVLNTLTTEGSWDSVKLGSKTIVTIAVVFLFLALLEWGGMWGLLRFNSRKYVIIRQAHLSWRMGLIVLIVPLLIVIATDKLLFAYANFYEMTRITRYQKLFPLYQPLFMDKTFEKYMGWKKDHSPVITYHKGSSLLNYPLKEPEIGANLKQWNFVWIIIESWRFDMINEEITPNIADFSRRAILFDRHFSGGNASRFGIFSLFYGIYGTYWHQFLAERRSPVFMDTLMKLNYEFKIMSSTKLTYPEMRSTAFVNMPEGAIEDQLPGKAGDERDIHMAERFREFLNNRNKGRPFFSFMFLDAPHAPYRYPGAFEKYTPVVDEVNYFQVKKNGAEVNRNYPLFNRYRNAIYFDDSVVGRILKDVEDADLLNNTIIVITGDHGEEFFETGYYGHNTTFSPYQAQVPFILYVPDMKPRKIVRLTSHLDLVPTMFSLMGVRTDPALYSQGRSLLDDTKRPYIVSSGWDTFAMIDDDVTIVLSTESYNAGMAEVHAGNYEIAENSKIVLKQKMGQLMEVTRNLGYFLR